MKSNVWKRTLAFVVLLCSITHITSCISVGSIASNLGNLSDFSNTSSARQLKEAEQVSASYELSAVREVELSTKLDCHLYQSNEPRLEVIAPSRERLEDLYYKIEGNKLIIFDKLIRKHGKIDSVDVEHHLAINLYLPGVQDIDLSGACSLEAKTDLNPYKLSIDCSGASAIVLGTINCDELKLDLSGAVSCIAKSLIARRVEADLSGAVALTLSGQVESLEGDFSGAVSANLSELKSRTAKIEASGACSVEVYASESLECEASGMVSVVYAGEPKTIKLDKTGMSSIKKR